MACKEIVELALDYLQGELEPERLRLLEKHLERCPACLNFLKTYAKVPGLARRAFRQRLSEGALSQLMERFRLEVR